MSSLVFQHSLRQSAACVESIQYSPQSKSFITVDHHALRSWNSTKQLRSFHLEKDFRLLLLDYIENCEVFLLIYSKPCLNCVYAELWSPELNSLCKVNLMQKVSSNVKCIMSANKSVLILTDENSNLVIYDVLIQKYNEQRPIVWFPKGIAFHPINERKSFCQHKLQLPVSQVISVSDANILSIQDLCVVNDELILIASERSLYVFKRAPESCLSEPQQGEGLSFQRDSSFQLIASHKSLLSNLEATVVTINAFPSKSSEYFTLVGYNNGSIGVFFLGNMENNSIHLNEIPTLLLVFQAHYPEANFPFKPLSLQLSPWTTAIGTTYLFEYFSIGSDFKIVHWGLRKQNADCEQHVVDMDMLGFHTFAIDSTDSFRYQNLKKENQQLSISLRVCPFVIQSLIPSHKFSRHCSSRGLMVSIGGMLGVLLVQQPCQLLLKFETPRSGGFVSAARSISKDYDETTGSEQVFFLLSEGNILAYSVRANAVIYQMTVPTHHAGHHPRDGKFSSSMECTPCCIHYSEPTSHLIIGYTDGTFCLCDIELEGLSIYQPSSKISPLKTFHPSDSLHTSPISFLNTISQLSPNMDGGSWLFVGDSAGNLSIWTIPNKSEPRFHENVALKTFVQGHINTISAIDIVLSSHYVSKNIIGSHLILSASSAGDLKAWSWSDSSGELTHVGGIHGRCERVTAVHVVSLEINDNEEVNMLCATGHSNGMIISWTFSSNPDRLRSEPMSSVSVHSGRVLSIYPANSYFSNASNISHALSASTDGSISLLNITSSGLISVLHIFYSPGKTHATFISECKNNIEVFQVYEDRIISFIAASNSSLIRPNWKESQRRINQADGSPLSEALISERKASSSSQFNLALELETALEPYSTDGLSENSPSSHQSFSTDVSIGQMNSLKIGHLSLKNLKHLTNREIWKANNQEFTVLHDEINDEDLESPEVTETQDRANLDNLETWNITLGVRVELQNAKKDKVLLDYFRQNCITAQFPAEVITARDAAEILDRWVAEVIKNNTIGDTITKKQVLDIFAVLNVSENDLLDFIKVAKLGAVLVTIHKNMVKAEPFLEQGIYSSNNRLRKKFSQMRTSKTVVMYNSMGEKVIQRKNLQMTTNSGIPNGYSSVLRRLWNQTSTRVPYHVNGISLVGYNHCVLMKNIPSHIKRIINRKVKTPQIWSSKLEHYFDIKRAVRISRTLLDMRQNYQQEFLQNATGVPTMSELMVKYFERNYGGGDMVIAHLKIVHFLESLCQYSDYSLINTLRYFIFSEEEHNSIIQKYIWLYIESRRWLFLHCKIVTGELIASQQHIKSDSLFEPSLISCGTNSALYLNWLLIQKSDSLLCLHEFLAVRGSYGPSVIENVRSVITHALISPSYEGSSLLSSHTSHYIDMEQYLEALIFETKKQDQLIVEIKEQIFGISAIPHNTRNSSHMTDENEFTSSADDIIQLRSKSVCNSLLVLLSKVQDMLQRFMCADCQRTGFTSSDAFKSVLISCLDNSAQNNLDQDYYADSLKMKLFQECLTRYSCGDGSDAIGYIDFVAMTMSWIYQQSENLFELHSSWILSAINSLRRGIDREQGKALLLFLASAQAFPSSIDHFWMAKTLRKENRFDNASLLSDSLPSLASVNSSETLLYPSTKGISYVGNWNFVSSIVSDNPGLLTIQKIPITLPPNSSSESALAVDGNEWKLLSMQSVDRSYVKNHIIPLTDRDLRTVHGEVCRSHILKKSAPAQIAVVELASNFDLSPLKRSPQSDSRLIEGIRYDVNPESVDQLPKSDNCRRHKSVSLHIPLQSNSDLDTNSHDQIQMNHEKDQLSSPQQHDKYNSYSTEYPSISLDRGYMALNSGLFKSANIYSPGDQEMCLETSLRDYQTMRKAEEDLLNEIDEVHVQTNLKIHEKFLAEKENQRRMKLKELESMRFKEIADDERMKRKQQALMLEEKARAMEEADRIAKDEETRKKQAEIRAARAAQEATKREKELLEAEIHRELLELQSMRKEEKLSRAIEKAIAEQIAREERLKAEQLAKEEAEREAARLKALFEEEKRIKAEQEALRQAEIAAKKLELERELLEQTCMSREDYDIGPDVTENEPIYEKTEDEDVIETPKVTPVELTGARLKLYNIIKRLIASKSGHKYHPRKNDNYKFFMPFNFGHDMRFDPFATDPTWTGPFLLDDEDESSMPKTGYDDISKILHEKKILLEKRKKNQLYHLNNPDIPSKDWTPMYRVNTVDWVEYFQQEFDQLKEQLNISSNLPTQLPDPINYDESEQSNMVEDVPAKTAFQVFSDTRLLPLPLGKVSKDQISAEHDHYYQIEIEDTCSILTVELTCDDGGDLEMYLACGYFPSTLKCDARGIRSLSEGTHTIVFCPDGGFQKFPIIIGVHLRTDGFQKTLPYSIWALRSINPHLSAEITRVNSLVHSFNLLSENTPDELWKNMPKLHRLAQGEGSNLLNQKNKSYQSDELLKTDSAILDPDLLDLENFVSKSGRMNMRSANVGSPSRGTYARLDKRMSPNHHSDLFIPGKSRAGLQFEPLKDCLPQIDDQYHLDPLKSALKYALDPEKYLKKSEETLPQLTPPSVGIDKCTLRSSSSLPKTTLPLIGHYSEVKPKAHPLRKYPNPKPIKYTIGK